MPTSNISVEELGMIPNLIFGNNSVAIFRRIGMLKQRLMTPGPTPVPEETLLELAKPVTFHRSGQFRAILAEVLEDLKYVYCTKNLVLPLTCSGTGAMEAAISSTATSVGDTNAPGAASRRRTPTVKISITATSAAHSQVA